jgi:hypothetical protein
MIFRTRDLLVRLPSFVTFLDQLLAFASPQIPWRIVCDRLGSFVDVALA